MEVEEFVSHAGVKRLDPRVLCWFPGIDETHLDVVSGNLGDGNRDHSRDFADALVLPEHVVSRSDVMAGPFE